MSFLQRLKYSKKPKWLQDLLNLPYSNPEEVTIRPKHIDYVVMEDFKFLPTEHMNTLVRTTNNPWFEGTRPNDLVLDIGACIGSVTIPLAFLVKKVVAVEPLWSEELLSNVRLNGLKNVEVLPAALWHKLELLTLSYGSKTSNLVATFTIEELLSRERTPFNFVKIDCEGAEWYIAPSQLTGIREIRIEYHLPRLEYKAYQTNLDLIKAKFLRMGYKVAIDRDMHSNLDLRFKEVAYLRASLKEEPPQWYRE